MPNDKKRLRGRRVLVVQCAPPDALALGATVARAGGHVTVARTRRAALVEIEQRRDGYDAAVVDDSLPGEGVANIVEALRRGEHPCLAVGLCSSEREVDRRRAVAAGVVELIPRPLRADTFLEAVERCAAATTCLRARIGGDDTVVPLRAVPRRPPHGIAKRPSLSDPARCRHEDLERRSSALARRRGLSQRELVVLRFIAMGYRYREIAHELSLSPRTVKMHAMNLRKKTGATDRLQLVRKIYKE
jgi:DNA-binding NarL/FixJ family response regulator